MLATSIDVVPINEMPRLAFNVKVLVAFRLPPSNANLLVVTDAGAPPKLASAPMDIAPPPIVVTPVYVLAVPKVKVPVPSLVKETVDKPSCKIPLKVVVELSPPAVRVGVPTLELVIRPVPAMEPTVSE